MGWRNGLLIIFTEGPADEASACELVVNCLYVPYLTGLID